MLGILFKAQVKAEKRQEFIDFIKWNIQVAKEREPGTPRFDLYQDPADENAFFVYEAYRDKKAFEEHQKNLPYQRWESQIRSEVVADFQPLFDGDAVCSVEMEDNIMQSGETLNKITGDIADEAGEAAYRVAATLLVNAVETLLIKQLAVDNPISDFLCKHTVLGEAAIGFALAAVIELSPLSELDDSGKRLAYQLRTGSIQLVLTAGLQNLSLISDIKAECYRALQGVSGKREPFVQTTPDAGAGAGPEKATKAKA